MDEDYMYMTRTEQLRVRYADCIDRCQRRRFSPGLEIQVPRASEREKEG